MEAGQGTIAGFEFGRFRVLPRQVRLGRIGSGVCREVDQAASDFSATLLAMAGHDLRQQSMRNRGYRSLLIQTRGRLLRRVS